ncbi:MAG: hypothetical protein Ct9H90mP30_6220 [Actinomycetota bacterium]|nr:MAG: hypothetical protein Ct9H90mP30_6220 [Actinomycetota bacterium]
MVEALDANCEVAEYSPTEVKLAVAGYGGAQKAEIQKDGSIASRHREETRTS